MCSCKFDQGTIIYGVRSEKYPEGPCYGVIITAMCDIAQRKVPKYYYLTALDASAWFCSAFGFAQTYASKRNDDAMLAALHTQLMELMKSLQCKPREIAVIAFDEKWLSNDGLRLLEEKTEKAFSILGRMESYPQDNFILTSPYDVNGLEFQAVILLGVDEGRVPQTIGTSDVSRHFIMYSAYNMLYLCASRAKYRVVVMGMELRGVSSCLNHSITAKTIEVEKHPEIVIA